MPNEPCVPTPGKKGKFSRKFSIVINNVSRNVEMIANLISFELKPYESESQYLEMLKIKQNDQNCVNSYLVDDRIVIIEVAVPKKPEDRIRKVGDVVGCLASMNIPVKGYNNNQPF